MKEDGFFMGVITVAGILAIVAMVVAVILTMRGAPSP